MGKRRSGTLIIVGGHECKDGDALILKAVVRQVGAGKLVVATVASELPEEMWETYERAFRRLGVKHLARLDVESREAASSPAKVKVLDEAEGVFFTGGDQLKVTMLLGGTAVCARLLDIYAEGGVVCGTSAGASAMSDTMIVGGGSKGSSRIGATVRMAPGLGLIRDVLIDQHFAERGRVGRLMGAVAQNPRLLGLGIDENTAIVVTDRNREFRVIGEGAVYACNAWEMTYSNLTEESSDRALSMFGTRVDVLSQGDIYDLETRLATCAPAEEIERDIEGAAKALEAD